jgi:hypothetical protein
MLILTRRVRETLMIDDDVAVACGIRQTDRSFESSRLTILASKCRSRWTPCMMRSVLSSHLFQ